MLNVLAREGDQFVVATFKTSPTEESEIYKKLDKSVRDAHESQVGIRMSGLTCLVN